MCHRDPGALHLFRRNVITWLKTPEPSGSTPEDGNLLHGLLLPTRRIGPEQRDLDIDADSHQPSSSLQA
jgi:hypothetical protein